MTTLKHILFEAFKNPKNGMLLLAYFSVNKLEVQASDMIFKTEKFKKNEVSEVKNFSSLTSFKKFKKFQDV